MNKIDIITPLEAADELPVVRRITTSDVFSALSRGIDDFRAMPTHVIFLCLIYPVVGLLMGRLAFGNDILPLIYPMAAGFALLGPFVAVGMYEMSRRRALGLATTWDHMFDVLRSPSLAAIVGIGGLLLIVFAVWVAVANAIYVAYLGPDEPASVRQFLHDVLQTRDGWNMIVAGNIAGLCFAVVAMALSVVSLPLLVDRNVGVAVALTTSLKAVVRNPVAMALWGLIVAMALLIGAVPLLIGLAVVVPVLGHATWHLYRAVIEPDERPRPAYHPRPRMQRYAADFPAVLLTLFMRGKD